MTKQPSYTKNSDLSGVSFKFRFDASNANLELEKNKFKKQFKQIAEHPHLLDKIFKNTCDYMIFCKKVNSKGTKRKYSDTQTVCTICLASNTNELYTTKCNHTFHKKCLFKATSIKLFCPLCRSSLLV